MKPRGDEMHEGSQCTRATAQLLGDILLGPNDAHLVGGVGIVDVDVVDGV